LVLKKGNNQKNTQTKTPTALYSYKFVHFLENVLNVYREETKRNLSYSDLKTGQCCDDFLFLLLWRKNLLVSTYVLTQKLYQ